MHQHTLRKSYLTTFLSLRALKRKIPSLFITAVDITLNFKFLNLRVFEIKILTLFIITVDVTLNFKSLNLFARYTLSKDLLLILKVIISWRNLRILFSLL